MDISVLISWKTRYDQVAWSFGYCPFCEQLEALRVANAIEVVSIWFVPVSRTVLGTVTFCDFCGRSIAPPHSAKKIGLSEWSPSEGLEALIARLRPSEQIEIPDANSNS